MTSTERRDTKPTVTTRIPTKSQSVDLVSFLSYQQSYGKKLKFSANGWLQVELLELELLENLEELEVEESAMPKFKSLQITNHKWLRKLPQGMKYVTALQVLELKGMSGRFVDRLRGQYHHKIPHVPSIIKS